MMQAKEKNSQNPLFLKQNPINFSLGNKNKIMSLNYQLFSLEMEIFFSNLN